MKKQQHPISIFNYPNYLFRENLSEKDIFAEDGVLLGAWRSSPPASTPSSPTKPSLAAAAVAAVSSNAAAAAVALPTSHLSLPNQSLYVSQSTAPAAVLPAATQVTKSAFNSTDLSPANSADNELSSIITAEGSSAAAVDTNAATGGDVLRTLPRRRWESRDNIALAASHAVVVQSSHVDCTTSGGGGVDPEVAAAADEAPAEASFDLTSRLTALPAKRREIADHHHHQRIQDLQQTIIVTEEQ